MSTIGTLQGLNCNWISCSRREESKWKEGVGDGVHWKGKLLKLSIGASKFYKDYKSLNYFHPDFASNSILDTWN